MYSIDLNQSRLNTQYDKKEFFSLGLEERPRVTTAKEWEKRFDDDTGLFKNPIDSIPGVEKIKEGMGAILVGAAMVRSKNPNMIISGTIAIAGGIVETTVGFGFLGYATYEAISKYFGDKPKYTNESKFHLIDPKDLNFNDSAKDKKANEGSGLLSDQGVNDFFEKMRDSLNRTMDSVNETTKSLKEGKESSMGGLSERGIGETGDNHLSENRSEYKLN